MTDEGEWYELVEWDELVDGKVERREGVTTEIKGPLENIMFVVPDAKMLRQYDYETSVQAAQNIHESAKKALRDSGWEGDVILVPSDIKLMRIRKVDL